MLWLAGRGEGARVANKYHVFVLKVLINVNYLISEALILLEFDYGYNCLGEFVSNFQRKVPCGVSE